MLLVTPLPAANQSLPRSRVPGALQRAFALLRRTGTQGPLGTLHHHGPRLCSAPLKGDALRPGHEAGP
jgi:hypothetical protein